MRVASAVSVAIGLALACAACSGDDDSADPGTTTTVAPTTSESPDDADIAETTDPPETTGAPDTTPAPTTVATTAAPSTTEPPATTSPETTSAPTSTQPRATDDQIAEFRQSVEADWREGTARWLAAVAQPTDAGLVLAALEYAADSVEAGRQRTLDGLIEAGRRGIQNESTPPSFEILVGPDPVDGLTVEASLSYCAIDSTVVLERQPDGTESVVNDDVVTEWWDAILRWNGEIWQVASLVLTDKQNGIVPCD